MADLILQSGADRRDDLLRIVTRIRRDNLRASDVIRRLRAPGVGWVLGAALALASIGGAIAEGEAPASPVVAPSAAQPTLDVLKGAWVRPDGGYIIAIKNVSPDGQLDAMYFNPNPLPFAKAEASRGVTLRAFFELRAGGYEGSTYDLTYDAASDRLRGTYYQAVAKQKFEVYFMRK